MTKCPTCGRSNAQRTDEEHNLLFAVIGAAFDNWPEIHAFRPVDTEHLRAWLQIEVNDVDEFEVPDVLAHDPQQIAQIGLFFTGGKRKFRMVSRGGHVMILRPRSLQKTGEGKRDLGEFRVVADAIYLLIEQITGITPESYKREREAARKRAMS